MEILTTIDSELLLAINGWRSLWADYFMYAFSGKIVWLPMYAAILYVLFRNLSWKVALVAVVAVALTITLADQISATLIRPYVERMRPSNLENPLSEFVQVVNGYRGGRYGFPSCHAANTFGLAFYVFYLFRNRLLTSFLMAWAVVTCYSRSYLGVHYPGDLLAGAFIGFLAASFSCWLFYWLARKYFHYDRPNEMKHMFVPVWVGGAIIVSMMIYAWISVL